MRTKQKFAPKQGQHLGFIHLYTELHGCPPAEVCIQRYFRIAPSAVHQMILTIEKRNLPDCVPGQSRSLRVRPSPEEIPELGGTEFSRAAIDELADAMLDAYGEFESALHASRAFPGKEFDVFFQSVVGYVETSKGSPLVHRNVASTLSGLRALLQTLRRNVPGDALHRADRLETMFFSGSDPYFESHEPPGLRAPSVAVEFWATRALTRIVGHEAAGASSRSI